MNQTVTATKTATKNQTKNKVNKEREETTLKINSIKAKILTGNQMPPAIPSIELTKENTIQKINKLSTAGGIRYALTTITPEIAELMIKETEKLNRDSTNCKITEYAEYMLTKRWLLNPCPIVFDNKGHLIDGGHRLKAVIKANKSVSFILCFGMETDVQSVIDQTNPRRVHEMAKIRGFAIDKKLSVHAAVTNSMFVESPASKKISITKILKTDLLQYYYKPIDKVVEMFEDEKHKCIKSSSIMSPIVKAMINYKENPSRLNMIKRFVKILTGDFCGSIKKIDDSARQLREWIMTSTGSLRAKPSRRTIYRKTEYALFSFIIKQPIENLVETRRELFQIEENELNKGLFDYSRVLTKKRGGMRYSHKGSRRNSNKNDE